MKRYVIQRDLPNIGKATAADFKQTVEASNAALKQLSPDIQWVESYITEDHSFCIYLAENEEVIAEHSRLSGIPFTIVTEVKRIVTPVFGS